MGNVDAGANLREVEVAAQLVLVRDQLAHLVRYVLQQRLLDPLQVGRASVVVELKTGAEAR